MARATTVTCDHCGAELFFDTPRIELTAQVRRDSHQGCGGDQSELCATPGCIAGGLARIAKTIASARVAWDENVRNRVAFTNIPVDERALWPVDRRGDITRPIAIGDESETNAEREPQ